MRILVCGGRDFQDDDWMARVLNEYLSEVTCIIHGDQKGADRRAGRWAKLNGIEVEEYPPDFDKYERVSTAFIMRNQQMIDDGRPDLVIAFPGRSGTADMIRRAREANIATVEYDPYGGRHKVAPIMRKRKSKVPADLPPPESRPIRRIITVEELDESLEQFEQMSTDKPKPVSYGRRLRRRR